MMEDNELELLTINEVINLFKIRESKLRRAILKKEIPYVKLGGLIRFKKADLIKYINEKSITYAQIRS